MPLAHRAARALTNARAADPHHRNREDSYPTRRLRARMARELAAILGVDPVTVTATADPDRSYGGYPGHLLTVIDNEVTYRFVPTGGFSEDGFCLLGPCPGCGSEVPVAEINQLADLGHYLETGPPQQFDNQLWDRRHHAGCPHGLDD